MQPLILRSRAGHGLERPLLTHVVDYPHDATRFLPQPDGTARFGRVEDGIVRALEAPSALAWLSGERGDETGEEHPLDAVTLLAPVPEPPSVRDFYAFEGHVAAGWRRRGGEIPDGLVRGARVLLLEPRVDPRPGRAVKRPEATRDARLRARDRRGDRRRRRDRGVHAA